MELVVSGNVQHGNVVQNDKCYSQLTRKEILKLRIQMLQIMCNVQNENVVTMLPTVLTD